MANFEQFIHEKLNDLNNENGKKMKIAFAEGWATRMQVAAESVDEDKLLTPVLIFETRDQYDNNPPDPTLPHFIIEEEVDLLNELTDKYVALRKGKDTKEAALEAMKGAPLFCAMLLKTNKVNGAIGGVYNSTAKILSSAFRAIGPAEGIKTISSVMLMHKGEEIHTFSDISVNPKPNEDAIVDIAINASNFVKSMGKKAKTAFLSFSTDGSANTDDTQKMAKATEKFNAKYNPKYPAIGEIQFDAAFDTDIRRNKYKKRGGFRKQATIYIFPDLASGNIGYKIAQRMGGWGAIGPIITGLKLPYNDLSRGSKSNDIQNTALITAIQAHAEEKNEQ